MATRRQRILATAALATLMLGLSACDGSVFPDQTVPPMPAPEATPTPIATIDPADVTCENMLTEGTVDEFLSNDWTVREDPFVILDLELPDGTSCTWGDFSSPTADDLILFGWSPIDEADAISVRDSLLSEGWLQEEDADGVLITEDPAFALRLDAEGYGVTYRFADGWVTVSDTKQGLDLIDPRP